MLEICDEAGNVILDATKQTLKFFGMLSIPPNVASGSLTDGRFTAFAGHVPYFARVDGFLPWPSQDATIWVDGNTLYWTRNTSPPGDWHVVLYGIAPV